MSGTGISSDLVGKAAGGRKLIAVVYADMVGYSRLIGMDDAGTLRRLRTLRRALIDPAIREHGGKVVQTAGDSLLVVFDSIDGAVRCAVKVQQQVPVYDGDQPPDRRIRFRVGINIGDVIAHGMDLHGNGVNIAARLEAECPVGGICVSRAVRDHVHGQLDLAFEAIGSLALKNIARTVEAFVVRLDPTAETSAPSVAADAAEAGTRVRWRATLVAGVVGLLVVVAAGAGWWLHRGTGAAPKASEAPSAAVVNPASTHATAQAFTAADVGLSKAPRPAAYSPEDRRQSVIVLPFENSSGDPNQDSIAAGITRDLTDRFARSPGVPVIPAATAAVYRGKTVDLQTLGRDHNVHFALTGSALRRDGRLIVSATLYEADSGRTLWSQRFDRPDNSDELNGVIGQIWAYCAQASVDAEVARAKREHPESLDKRDLILAESASSLASPSKENYLAEIALVERALAIDPDYLGALEEKANLHTLLVSDGYSSDPSADLATAMKAADRALQLAPNDIWALRRKAFVLDTQGDWEGAAALIRKVLELEPLDGWRYRELGHIQMSQGHFKEALENLTTAKRLGGWPPSPAFGQSLALGLLANDRFPEAIAEAQLATAQWQSNVGRIAEWSWLALIAAESENGQDAEARADLQKFLATPRTYRTLAEVQKNSRFAANRKLLDGLRRAGMPAE